MLNRRLQILVDDERYERLARRASAQGTSIAVLSRSGRLVSADRVFSSVPGLAHVTPGTPQFDELLG